MAIQPNQFISLSDTSWTNWGEIISFEKQLKRTKGRSDIVMPWAGWRGSLKIDEEKAEKLFGRRKSGKGS